MYRIKIFMSQDHYDINRKCRWPVLKWAVMCLWYLFYLFCF